MSETSASRVLKQAAASAEVFSHLLTEVLRTFKAPQAPATWRSLHEASANAARKLAGRDGAQHVLRGHWKPQLQSAHGFILHVQQEASTLVHFKEQANVCMLPVAYAPQYFPMHKELEGSLAAPKAVARRPSAHRKEAQGSANPESHHNIHHLLHQLAIMQLVTSSLRRHLLQLPDGQCLKETPSNFN